MFRDCIELLNELLMELLEVLLKLLQSFCLRVHRCRGPLHRVTFAAVRVPLAAVQAQELYRGLVGGCIGNLDKEFVLLFSSVLILVYYDVSYDIILYLKVL